MDAFCDIGGHAKVAPALRVLFASLLEQEFPDVFNADKCSGSAVHVGIAGEHTNVSACGDTDSNSAFLCEVQRLCAEKNHMHAGGGIW